MGSGWIRVPLEDWIPSRILCVTSRSSVGSCSSEDQDETVKWVNVIDPETLRNTKCMKSVKVVKTETEL